MPEENVNTMSENTESKDEKQKGRSGLDARTMHKADVEALANKLTAMSEKVLNKLVDLRNGDSYADAEDAILAFADEMLFGSFYDFREKNMWLKSIGYEDLDRLANADIGQTPEDLMTCLEMFRVINGKGGEHLNNVYHYIQDAVTGSYFLRIAYRVFRKDNIMYDAHNSEMLGIIDNACDEFYNITSRYTNASICNEIPVKKENSLEMNCQLVEDHMLAEIGKSPNLYLLIHDSLKRPSPAFVNYFMILDADTKSLTLLPEISKFADEIAKIATLDNDVSAYFNNTGKLTAPLAKAIHSVLDYIRTIYAEARDVLNNYKYNTQQFPYSLMHYSPSVQRAVESCNNMSLNDPTQNGTRYMIIYESMLSRCQKLCTMVAKAAP